MFEKDQKVWCAIYGAGVVARIRQEAGVDYPVVVLFKSNGDENVVTYTTDGKYHEAGNIVLFPHPVEIVKATIKPSIDWSHVSEEFQYLAMNKEGLHLLFAEEPTRGDVEWTAPAPYELYILAEHFASFVPGTCSWKDSLVKRPN